MKVVGAVWRNSPEGHAQVLENLRRWHEIPSLGTGRGLEPLFGCPECGNGPERPLAFRTQQEQDEHYASRQHKRRMRELGLPLC